jgi:uncharacterized protein
MRTTLTLDDDVAAKLKAAARRSGRSFRDVVNDVLRHGLATPQERTPPVPFRVQARDLAALRPGLSLDRIADLIEQTEGPHHAGSELVRFAWVTVWAFLRIATTPRVFERPLSTAEAESAVASWLSQPCAGILEPGDRHWEILREMMRSGQTTGLLVMDAAVAAIALEHGATLWTTDRGFSRFPRLRWANPLTTG